MFSIQVEKKRKGLVQVATEQTRGRAKADKAADIVVGECQLKRVIFSKERQSGMR